jgi:hypothetical protein
VNVASLGYFHERAAADAAYNDLVQAGIPSDAISVLGPGAEGRGGLDHDDGASVAGGAGVGAIEGLLLGAAAMLIPGLGPIVAIGPLAAALTGAVTGGVTGAVVGGVVGALEQAGVAHDTARYYDERLRQGGILLAVHTTAEEAGGVRAMLARHGADVCESGEGTPDWPSGEDVPLSRNDRRQYLSGPEDMARTTMARDPDDWEPVDDSSRRP